MKIVEIYCLPDGCSIGHTILTGYVINDDGVAVRFDFCEICWSKHEKDE